MDRFVGAAQRRLSQNSSNMQSNNSKMLLWTVSCDLHIQELPKNAKLLSYLPYDAEFPCQCLLMTICASNPLTRNYNSPAVSHLSCPEKTKDKKTCATFLKVCEHCCGSQPYVMSQRQLILPLALPVLVTHSGRRPSGSAVLFPGRSFRIITWGFSTWKNKGLKMGMRWKVYLCRFWNPPVPITVLQVCEGLVEKIVQVEADTVACAAAFRSDGKHGG